MRKKGKIVKSFQSIMAIGEICQRRSQPQCTIVNLSEFFFENSWPWEKIVKKDHIKGVILSTFKKTILKTRGHCVQLSTFKNSLLESHDNSVQLSTFKKISLKSHSHSGKLSKKTTGTVYNNSSQRVILSKQACRKVLKIGGAITLEPAKSWEGLKEGLFT